MCGEPSTVHLTQTIGGKAVDRQFCEKCAVEMEAIPIHKALPAYLRARIEGIYRRQGQHGKPESPEEPPT
jgi:protein-arginine kinase activator protein McsA